jgi:nitroimidazol reductase NimA-like FMN-containing flavoprotein (pyridoxamine 5'-phosphate oxidase superfamily)
MVKIVKVDSWGRTMTEQETIEFLRKPLLMRVAMIDQDGYPMVHPMWFIYENGKFLLATNRNGTKAKLLQRNAKVYFTIDTVTKETGPWGVRGRGRGRVINDAKYAEEVTKKQLIRYIGSLEGSVAKQLLDEAKSDTVVIEITPSFLGTWRHR